MKALLIWKIIMFVIFCTLGGAMMTKITANIADTIRLVNCYP